MAVVEVEVNPEVEANSEAEVETKEAALVPEADIIIIEEHTEFDSAPRTAIMPKNICRSSSIAAVRSVSGAIATGTVARLCPLCAAVSLHRECRPSQSK